MITRQAFGWSRLVTAFVCLVSLVHRGLWGRAQVLLAQAARSLGDEGLRRHAWRALAEMAEQRGDTVAAAEAWKRAATA